MKFFLGTHRPAWLGRLEFTNVPLFVSHETLKTRKSMPKAVCDWGLDSGGFTQLTRNLEGWPKGSEEPYADRVRFYMTAGRLEFASQQDWMCEPWLLRNRSVREHQERTVENYLKLMELAPDIPWLPVLQGWEIDDYHNHVDLFSSGGVNLVAQHRVGVGSVCRRQASQEIGQIVSSLAARKLSIHGFGVKARGLSLYHHHLQSADSMAWSYRARRRDPLPGCRHGKSGEGNCANCPSFALWWRERLLTGLEGAL